MRLAVALLLAPLAAAVAQAPTADAALHGFIAQARAGTARYRDPEVARAAGYRPVGPDFPGMGRHWVHPALILRDSLEPAEPPILEYAEIAGRLTLVGVAYARLLRDGPPPPELPVPAAAWHFHQGTVQEESFLRTHAHVAPVGPQGGGGPKIAVLHAWIWLDNPDGVLATDNWSLPYARLGYPAPPASAQGAPREAARALALAAGDAGRAYVEALLRAVGRPSVEETRALNALVLRHQAAVRRLLADRPDGPVPVEALARCWSALWEEVRGAVRPEVGERLQAIH